jgi:CBS domain containing-hemolysin-like protein
MGTSGSILLIVFMVVLAGFFAGSETAIVSCSKVKLRSHAKHGSWRARLLEKFIAVPEEFFSIVLVGTNLAVVVCTAVATALAVDLAGDNGGIISVVVMTPVLLIFGEVIPKSAFHYHADRVSMIVAPFLKFFHFILYPLILPASFLARLSGRITGSDSKKFYILSAREELVYLYRRGMKSEDRMEREGLIIDRIFNFSKLRVGQLMIPWSNVISFSVTASVDEVIEEANRHTYSRFPLVSPNDGRVVGIISLFDLLGLDGGERLATVMHAPVCVREDESAERVLLLMKDEQLHFAVVTGAGGEALGIITLENILESVMGEIANEYE